MMLVVAIVSVVIAAIPAIMFFANLQHFCVDESRSVGPCDVSRVSVLIPARDEALGIAASVDAARNSRKVEVEVVVLDDHSTDATAEIVQAIAEEDPRVRCVQGEPLPEGWNGKQFACRQLAEHATHEHFVFIDADVRLKPNALRWLLDYQGRNVNGLEIALLSAFPRQETGTWLEKLLIPMMHYILLGYLPFSRMKSSVHPAYAAGCGQLFLTHREAYNSAGTHAAIQGSRHDGVKLPRAYRGKSLMTDVVDGTTLADCRMYHGAAQTIRGVLKNATEGIANPKLIGLFTVLLLGGSVLPVVLLIGSMIQGDVTVMCISALGVLLGHLPRAVAAARFRQSWIGVLGHSLAAAIFVALQWIALAMSLLGQQVSWRGRTSV